MFRPKNRISSYATFIVLASVVGIGLETIRYAHAALTPTEISARITVLSGKTPSDIGEIFAAEQTANVLIIASDILIPIVLDPKVAYLLIRDATTGTWTRVYIDLDEWNSDFVTYFAAQGVEYHTQPHGTVDANTPAQEAAQIASIAASTGTEIANLILNGAPPVTNTTNYTYDEVGRLKTVTYPGGKVVTFGYDENGNRETLTTTGGQ